MARHQLGWTHWVRTPGRLLLSPDSPARDGGALTSSPSCWGRSRAPPAPRAGHRTSPPELHPPRTTLVSHGAAPAPRPPSSEKATPSPFTLSLKDVKPGNTVLSAGPLVFVAISRAEMIRVRRKKQEFCSQHRPPGLRENAAAAIPRVWARRGWPEGGGPTRGQVRPSECWPSADEPSGEEEGK